MKKRGGGSCNRCGRWEEAGPRLRRSLRDHPDGLQTAGSAGKCHREEGLVEAKKRGPYASYLVDLDLSTENAGTGVFAPCLCWFGGPKEQWLGFLHNSESLHAVLNKPVCDCGAQHQREDPADLEQEDDEYPPAWSWQKEPMTS